MVTKLARFHIFGRGPEQRAGTVAEYCNDNRSVRRPVTNSQPMPRRILVCHWREAPLTGALECSWHIESGDASAAEEPGIGWLIGKVQWLLGAGMAWAGCLGPVAAGAIG